MVVAGLNSFNQRIGESVRFMDWGFRAWQAKPVVKQGRKVADAAVQLGDASTVGLVAPRELKVALPSGAVPAMSGKVVYNGPLKAPIKAGTHVADLVITSPGLPQQTLPLVAESDVGEAGFFGRAWAGFTGLFG